MAAIKPAPLEKTHYFVKVEFFPCGKIEPPPKQNKKTYGYPFEWTKPEYWELEGVAG